MANWPCDYCTYAFDTEFEMDFHETNNCKVRQRNAMLKQFLWTSVLCVAWLLYANMFRPLPKPPLPEARAEIHSSPYIADGRLLLTNGTERTVAVAIRWEENIQQGFDLCPTGAACFRLVPNTGVSLGK